MPQHDLADEPKFPTEQEARERLARRLETRRAQPIGKHSLELADKLDYAADAKDASNT